MCYLPLKRQCLVSQSILGTCFHLSSWYSKASSFPLTLYRLNSFFVIFRDIAYDRLFSLSFLRLLTHSRYAHRKFFLMIPSKIKIGSFAKGCHMGTLEGKGLMDVQWAACSTFLSTTSAGEVPSASMHWVVGRVGPLPAMRLSFFSSFLMLSYDLET